MPNERNYYVVCEDNCRFEGMTKEQIIAAIAEATGATPTQIDAAFITKIKEQNANTALKFWVGTSAEYNAIATPPNDVFYILTDETWADEVLAKLNDIEIREADTGWIDITINSTAIGKYRILGKTIYISINFDWNTYGTINEVQLPYLLDTGSAMKYFPAYMHPAVQQTGAVDAGIVLYRNGYLTLESELEGTYTNVSLFISAPVGQVNTNYVG